MTSGGTLTETAAHIDRAWFTSPVWVINSWLHL